MRPTDPRVLSALTPARRPLVGVIAAGVVSSLLVLAQAWMITGLVLAVLSGHGVTGWAGGVVAVFALRAAVNSASEVLASRAAALVGASLRRRILAATLSPDTAVPPSSSTRTTGGLSALATRGVNAAEPYLTRYLPSAVLACVLPLLTLAAIASQDLLSALVVACTLPLVPLFGALVGLSTRDRAQEQWQAMSSLSGHFLDVVRGLPTLIAFDRARAQSGRIASITDRYRRASMSTLRVAFASSAVLELVATLSVALVAVQVGLRLATGGLDLRTALLVLLLAPEAYWPLRRMGAEFHAAAEGVATFEAVDALTGSPSRPATVHPAPVGSTTTAGLAIEGLTVRYAGRTQPVLENLSDLVPALGVTVVSGPSGCGKSTLLAVLAGLHPAASGSVLRDGVPIGGPDWRAQVAWLPQRPVFVAGSIADNLRLADPGCDDDTLWAALRRVALEERVRDLSRGLATPVGEDGTTLSAGERARLALARVVVADRPWVLLDEPTAHLDALTEQIIADTLVDLGRSAAVVVVAHRPAVLALADHHLVLTAPVPAPRPETPRSPDPAPDPMPEPTSDPALGRPGDPDLGDPDLDAPDPGARALGVSACLGSLASASGVALTATAGWLVVQASTQPAILTLMVAIVGVRAFGLARPVLHYAERLRSHDVALRMLARERVRVFDAIVPLTPGRLGRRRGDVLTSVVDDVDSVVDRELRVRLPLVVLGLVTLGAAAVTAAILPVAGLVVLATGGLAAGAGFVTARRGAGRCEQDGVAQRAALSSAVVEVSQLAPEIVMWQAERAALDRVAVLGDRLATSAAGAARWLAVARAAVLLVHGAGIAATAVVVTPAVAAGRVSGPLAALLVLVPLALLEVTAPAADAGALSARTRAAAARLTRLVRTPPAVRDTVATDAASSARLELDVVSAGWDRVVPAVTGLCLVVQPGTRWAVTGATGSGKSTVAALLVRFLDPLRGCVSLGGAPLPTLTLADVRGRVGLVDDDPHVFATTLIENVRLARPAATTAEVEAALRRACLGDWLDALPEGLHTWLGDGHAAVSGGERARIAVARSVLADQAVLVLDEPTAHLDHATATAVAREVLLEGSGRSVVWISHDGVGLDLVDEVADLSARPRVPHVLG